MIKIIICDETLIPPFNEPARDLRVLNKPLWLHQRDVLFFSRADVVILLWNGKSSGTEGMINWYRENEKDHIVGFVGERQ